MHDFPSSNDTSEKSTSYISSSSPQEEKTKVVAISIK